MNFAILAPGRIAITMAQTVTKMSNINCYAVASRDISKAQKFADEWGFSKAFGSYEEMLLDEEVDLVYVCTPHSLHYKYAKLCLEHGKHVLVEKAFTVNAKQAKELIDIAREKKLLLAEAIWTRYMPSRDMIDRILEEGLIGEVKSLTANLGYALQDKERLNKPELAGGALLDLGVYTINFALMVMKDKILDIKTDALMSPLGVDWIDNINMYFEGGKLASLHSTMLSRTNRLGLICGDKGYIEVININDCEEIKVYNNDGELLNTYDIPEQITGFEYEVEACVNAIEAGECECSQMPHSEIIRVMEIMDQVREIWGMKLPCE